MKLSPALVRFGIKKEANDLRYSDPEKTILDFIYLARQKGTSADNTLPPYLEEIINDIRYIGNVGAHPIKNVTTGEIVDVERDEAVWTLHVLRELFDFYFVQPAEYKRRRESLSQKVNLNKRK